MSKGSVVGTEQVVSENRTGPDWAGPADQEWPGSILTLSGPVRSDTEGEENRDSADTLKDRIYMHPSPTLPYTSPGSLGTTHVSPSS